MKKIPKYKSLRIFIISGIFYFFLVMPFMGFIIIQNIPDLLEKGFFSMGPDGADLGPIQISFNDSLVSSDSIDDFNQIINNQMDTLEVSDFINDKGEINENAITTIIDTSRFKVQLAEDSLKSPTNILGQLQKEDDNPRYFSISFDIFFYGIILALFLTFIFSYPFKRFFRRKRSGKPVSTRLEFFCRRYLLYTPFINATLFGLVMLSTVGYIGYVNLFEDLSKNANGEIFDEYFYIAALSGFLSTIFVFYWQKHRVHIYYLEVLFDEDELRKRIFRRSIGRIRNRLWLASGMTTLLPLGIVIFYLILSITRLSDINVDLNNEHIREVLLGNYNQIFLNERDLSNYIYINSINAYMMLFGIGTSIFISLIYIVTFVRWTTQDIVFPVKELLSNMQKTDKGKTSHFSVVRTNDEIGELAEGFNLMSQRIKNYIDDINEINNSYYRFVPKQFLDFLDKKNVTDIHLGDQVQKEMTVMFSDIRSFTQISENMTPRDNFNFINHYLGYMEPVISRNNGFIDKYIGDAIMALFAESVDDALDAAIEMRAKLNEFNEDLKLNGKEPINNGIGINTGNLMLGIVGGKGRIEGTVISDHVNLASRLEGLTVKYGTSILISQDTLIKLNHPERYQFRFLDTVVVKGKRNSVNIFEILNGEPTEIRNSKIATKQKFSQAQELYKAKKFQEAHVLFLEIEKESPNDVANKIYIKRCDDILQNGIPDDWDGVESLTSK
ncbi:MAG: HAMP domain-containing protein [Bacteroidales bacterium]|nr:HAMP domain-containing protein [Bacteroidales bacterium]